MKPIGGIDWRLLKTAWCDVDSFFIVGDWAHLPTVAVILARCLRRAPVAIWTDAPQEEVKRPALKQWLREQIFQMVAGPSGYRLRHRGKALRLLLGMGARPEHLINLPYLVDLQQPIEASRESKYKEKSPRVAGRLAMLSQWDSLFSI